MAVSGSSARASTVWITRQLPSSCTTLPCIPPSDLAAVDASQTLRWILPPWASPVIPPATLSTQHLSLSISLYLPPQVQGRSYIWVTENRLETNMAQGCHPCCGPAQDNIEVTYWDEPRLGLLPNVHAENLFMQKRRCPAYDRVVQRQLPLLLHGVHVTSCVHCIVLPRLLLCRRGSVPGAV